LQDKFVCEIFHTSPSGRRNSNM